MEATTKRTLDLTVSKEATEGGDHQRSDMIYFQGHSGSCVNTKL